MFAGSWSPTVWCVFVIECCLGDGMTPSHGTVLTDTREVAILTLVTVAFTV